MALHSGEAIKQDQSLGTADMRLKLLANGSAGECGVKDQVSCSRDWQKKGGGLWSVPFSIIAASAHIWIFRFLSALSLAHLSCKLQNEIVA